MNGTRVPSGRSQAASWPRTMRFSFSATAIGHASCGIGTPMPHDACPMAVALKENRIVRGQEAACERPDGTRVPFIPYPTPLHDESGKLVGAVNMLVDITERKRTEEQQALLVRELHHRVKNTLA